MCMCKIIIYIHSFQPTYQKFAVTDIFLWNTVLIRAITFWRVRNDFKYMRVSPELLVYLWRASLKHIICIFAYLYTRIRPVGNATHVVPRTRVLYVDSHFVKYQETNCRCNESKNSVNTYMYTLSYLLRCTILFNPIVLMGILNCMFNSRSFWHNKDLYWNVHTYIAKHGLCPLRFDWPCTHIRRKSYNGHRHFPLCPVIVLKQEKDKK